MFFSAKISFGCINKNIKYRFLSLTRTTHFSICDLAKYTVSLFGRNSCSLYTISVVCHINLTNGWMTVLLPCEIDTRQAAILMVGGLQVLYVIVGQKPLVRWRKLNNTKRVSRNRNFYLEQFPQIPYHFNTYCTCICWKVGTQTYMYLCLYLKVGEGHVFPQPRSLQQCLILVHFVVIN